MDGLETGVDKWIADLWDPLKSITSLAEVSLLLLHTFACFMVPHLQFAEYGGVVPQTRKV